MALATRCPACSTVFRITTAQAAAKGGMVRCGRCSHAFNSLDALVRVEDLDVLVEEEPPPPMIDEIVEVEAAVEPPAPPAPVGQAVFSEWWLPPVAADTIRPGLEQAPHAEGLAADASDVLATGQSRDFGGQSPTGRRTETPAADESTDPPPATFLEPEARRAPRSRSETWTLGALSILALLVLFGQVLYVYRNEVAARWPETRAVLAAACAPIRCVVDYPARPTAITIESAAVETANPAGNLYVLSALLRNRDPVAVRYPYLELVLTDMQDRILLRRALRPQDYLAPGRAAGGFAGQSELPIRLAFELDELRFTGYRLESFYP